MKRWSLIGVVLRKDFQILWPLATLTALLLLLSRTLSDPTGSSLLAALFEIACALAGAFLILSVIQEDAVVSSQHDWLIRPLPGFYVAIAKLIFVFATLYLPLMISEFVTGLTRGYPISEALRDSFTIRGDIALAMAMAIVIAAVSASGRQAALVFVAAGAIVAVGLNAAVHVSNLTDDLGTSGLEWIVASGIAIAAYLLCAVVLYLQYVHRKTSASYGVIAAALLAVFGVLFLPWSSFFAVQKALSKESDVAHALQIDLANGCFVSAALGAGASEAANKGDAQLPTVYRVEPGSEDVGPNAIGFATMLAQAALPPDTRLLVSHVAATYLDGANGQFKLRPARPYPEPRRDAESIRLHRHYWRLSRAKYEQLASNPQAQLQLDYSLTFLRVERSIEIVADGRRAYHEGLGYCGAALDAPGALIVVDCFVPGEQPAQLQAQIVGDSDLSARRSRYPNYVPDALDALGGKRHWVSLPAQGRQAPRVKITTYEARAHFDRQFIVPGVLGGSAADCPAPM